MTSVGRRRPAAGWCVRAGISSPVTCALVLYAAVANAAGDILPDTADHPAFAHAMDVHVERIDGVPVVFDHGQVRPDFADGVRSSTRTRRLLADGWRFRFDPNDEGQTSGWALGDFDDSGWSRVTVPHCWDMTPGGRFWDWSNRSASNPPHYDGAAWYRLAFDHEAGAAARQRIEFLGVSQRARVYFNGVEIARHEGGGQPLSVDVSDHLRPGRNQLAVKVIRLANFERGGEGDPTHAAEIDHVHTAHPKAPDNWPYAGLIRPVSLLTEPAVTARKVLVRTAADTVETAVVVCNHGREPATVTVRVESPAVLAAGEQKRLEVAAGGVRVAKIRMPLSDHAERWSPERPRLHEATVRLTSAAGIVDEQCLRFGIREFAAKDGRFLLGSTPVFLKGASLYEETRERGAAMLPEDHAWLLDLAKQAGMNFLRFPVVQRAPVAYRLADERGLLVTGEWGGFWYREGSMGAQVADARSVFLSHGRCAVWDLLNHPSVVLWCIHNESHQFCEQYEPFVRAGRDLVRELDWQRRPVTWAAWNPVKGEPHFEHADAIGFNEYRGAMDPFEDLAPDVDATVRNNPGKPLVILENGGWATRGRRGAAEDKGTEDWQADLLVRQHQVLADRTPPLAGYTYWILMDYRSRKPYTGNPDADGYSMMGMYDSEGLPKVVRDVFRDLIWERRPVAARR